MIVVGLSHRNAPISVREQIALSGDRLDAALKQMVNHPAISEALILSTCNRTEVYVSPDASKENEREAVDAILEVLANLGGREALPHLTVRHGHEATLHLFRVAASLDSLVVGEPQILGQVKEAARLATKAGTIGPSLSAELRGSLGCAKRVRRETAIARGQVSIPSVAIGLAEQIFSDLKQQNALLIGAGEMAETAAKLLTRRGASLRVVNRSADRAQRLAKAVGGHAATWDELQNGLAEADIVISSTASQTPILSKAMLKKVRRKRRGKSLFLIDIAVPRDIDPEVNGLDGIYLYDIDDLSHVVSQSLEDRAEEAKRAEDMVQEQAKDFARRCAERAVDPVIVGLRRKTKQILQSELERSRKGRLQHLSADDQQAIEALFESAANKWLHAPSSQLKKLASHSGAHHAAQLVCELFGIDPSVDLINGQSATIEIDELDDTHDPEADDQDKRHAG